MKTKRIPNHTFHVSVMHDAAQVLDTPSCSLVDLYGILKAVDGTCQSPHLAGCVRDGQKDIGCMAKRVRDYDTLGVSMAVYADGRRRKADIEQVTGMVFDYDEGDPEAMMEAASQLGVACVLHRSTTKGIHVFLPFAAPIQYPGDRKWQWLHAEVGKWIEQRTGLVADDGAKDASRFILGSFRKHDIGVLPVPGEYMDAAAMLAEYVEPVRETKRTKQRAVRKAVAVKAAPMPAAFRKWMDKHIDAVETAEEGVRNDTLNKRASLVLTSCYYHGIGTDAALQSLRMAGLAAGLGEAEVEATLRSADEYARSRGLELAAKWDSYISRPGPVSAYRLVMRHVRGRLVKVAGKVYEVADGVVEEVEDPMAYLDNLVGGLAEELDRELLPVLYKPVRPTVAKLANANSFSVLDRVLSNLEQAQEHIHAVAFRDGKSLVFREGEGVITHRLPVDSLPEDVEALRAIYESSPVKRWMDSVLYPWQQDLLQGYLAQLLRGEGNGQKIIVLEGPGGSGKTTFLELLEQALGDYAVRVPVDAFAAKTKASQAALAKLQGARLALVDELERTALDAGVLKEAVNGRRGIVHAHVYFQGPVSFEYHGGFICTSNYNFRASTQDSHLMRRVVQLHVDKLVQAPQDESVVEAARADVKGMVAWLLLGALSGMRMEVPANVYADMKGRMAEDSDMLSAMEYFRFDVRGKEGGMRRSTFHRALEVVRRKLALGYRRLTARQLGHDYLVNQVFGKVEQWKDSKGIWMVNVLPNSDLLELVAGTDVEEAIKRVLMQDKVHSFAPATEPAALPEQQPAPMPEQQPEQGPTQDSGLISNTQEVKMKVPTNPPTYVRGPIPTAQSIMAHSQLPTKGTKQLTTKDTNVESANAESEEVSDTQVKHKDSGPVGLGTKPNTNYRNADECLRFYANLVGPQHIKGQSGSSEQATKEQATNAKWQRAE